MVGDPMKKTVWKDIFKEIRRSMGRFLAIFAISAIGVAFFAGVTATSEDMLYSADAYFDEYNLMDLYILSTTGFTDTDVEEIRQASGIQGVYASHTMDVLWKTETEERVVKLMSLPAGETGEDNEDYINRLRLVEGRLPENSGECVIKLESIRNCGVEIGDTITLGFSEGDITQVLAADTYTVVGFVYAPYYLSYELGSSEIGNGSVSFLVIVPDSDFLLGYYTEVYATLEGAKEKDSYSDAYFDLVEPVAEEVENLNEEGNWHVLDRNSHYSYRDYQSVAEQMKKIAVIFPVFFYFVAVLVCLTTMTRMVDENRGSIGIYKALGYGKWAIAAKFVLYALIASLTGGMIGAAVGMRLFPSVIYYTWNIVYQMPDISFAPQPVLALAAILSMSAFTTAAAFAACYRDLSDAPAMLMRPKAPKKGKKIFLERLPFLWKRCSFAWKITLRNIFRYKKRFVMTLIGIAGCSALLLTGFGIGDSISGLVNNQFTEIFQFDFVCTFNSRTQEERREEIFKEVLADENVSDGMMTLKYTGLANCVEEENSDHQDKEVTVFSVSNAEEAKKYMVLRKRSSDITYTMETDGVYISELLAKELGLEEGDTIFLESCEGTRKELRVNAVVEMYVDHYIFMLDEYYEEVFGEDAAKNSFIAALHENEQSSDSVEDAVGKLVLAYDEVESISFFSMSIEKFQDMIESLNMVTAVLILSSALLAFVVLYNLTNVNISERVREIATIKVLGFYHSEVSAYVYRENMLITAMGALLGLGLGVFLHNFIMETIEMDTVMFGNGRDLSSYLISFVLTFLFGVAVNIVMYRKLRDIPMVESLKSVE